MESSYKPFIQCPLRLASHMTIEHLPKLRNYLSTTHTINEIREFIYLDIMSLSTNVFFLFQYLIQDLTWGIS